MKTRAVAYWSATLLTAFSFVTGGTAYLTQGAAVAQGLGALGYPAYLVPLLGVWKVLGGLAILVPRFPRLKEWAYAGIVFDLTGATFSHLAMGDAASTALTPLVVLAIAAASWALRPASRRTASAVKPSTAPHLRRAAEGAA
jgi:uncharacterized membrane protein YphA (DoxX/SURF4 family)